jgi:hypothetical protein
MKSAIGRLPRRIEVSGRHRCAERQANTLRLVTASEIISAQARHCVFAYIEGWYNTTRMHSSLDYKSLVQIERDFVIQSVNAANDSPINVPSKNSQSARLTKGAA